MYVCLDKEGEEPLKNLKAMHVNNRLSASELPKHGVFHRGTFIIDEIYFAQFCQLARQQ